jgi:tetratricopeptide (TPR) repeat protein
VAKHKQIVKDLKRPDQFVDFWTHASQRVVAVVAPRRKPVIALVVALVVSFVGISIINYVDGNKRLAASRSLARIQEVANAELLDGTSDAKDGPKDGVPRFKTYAEQQTAVLKELDAFLATSPAAGLKEEALVMKGATLLSAGKSDDAITSYQAALSGRLDARLRFLAHEGLGYAFEGKGDLDKALAAFGQLSSDATEFRGFYQDRALFHKARLTEAKGDKAGAVATYRQILDKVPDTTMKDEITDRLALLEAK